jgi:pyruvate dehydrogenase E1 component alpha subunit
VPRNRLKQDIINGRSMSLCYPEYKIFSSAIVAGNIPIANGVAFDIKNKKSTEHVWCFIGDMTSQTGCFAENYEYATNFKLPITWIIEDNNKSVCTDTKKTWNTDILSYHNKNVISYKYISNYPHAGIGKRIEF